MYKYKFSISVVLILSLFASLLPYQACAADIETDAYISYAKEDVPEQSAEMPDSVLENSSTQDAESEASHLYDNACELASENGGSNMQYEEYELTDEEEAGPASDFNNETNDNNSDHENEELYGSSDMDLNNSEAESDSDPDSLSLNDSTEMNNPDSLLYSKDTEPLSVPESSEEAINQQAVLASDGTQGASAGNPDWAKELMNLSATKRKAEEASEELAERKVLVAVIDTGIRSDSIFNGRINENSGYFDISGIFHSGEYEDKGYHGTQVAGIIADNTPSNVELLILKALDYDNNGIPRGSADQVASAIRYAASCGADIINLSLTVTGQNNQYEVWTDPDEYTEYMDSLDNALSYAANTIIVSAAGNNGQDVDQIGAYPAGSGYCITVNSLSDRSTSNEEGTTLDLSSWSNYGSSVDFCAPGEGIYKTVNGGYEWWEGTSMAAPFISSACALIKLSDLTLNKDQIFQILIDSSCGVDSKDPYFGYGLPVLNIDYAEQEITPYQPDQPYFTSVTTDGCSVSLAWKTLESDTAYVWRKESDKEDYSHAGFTQIGVSDNGQFKDEDVELGKSYIYYIEERDAEHLKNNTCKNRKIKVSRQDVQLSIQRQDDMTVIIRSQPIFLEKGATIQLKALVNDIAEENVIWKSEDASVVEVDNNGYIKAIKTGSSSISVKTLDNHSTACLISVTDNQKCGDDVYWSIDSTGKELTIYGNGPMWNYIDRNSISHLAKPAPWDTIKDNITSIVITEGVTAVGAYAFKNMSSLESVEMADVTTIGEKAFYEDPQLGTVQFSPSLQIIEDSSFGSCRNLNQIDFPEGLQTIEYGAFGSCYLKEINLPDSVQYIGENAFLGSCPEKINIPLSVKNVDAIPGLLPNYNFDTNNYVVPAEHDAFCEIDGVVFSNDKRTLYIYPSGKTDTTYVMPDTVKTIGAWAFCNNQLESISFPEGLTTISERAFYQNPGLWWVNSSAKKRLGIRELYLPSSVEKIQKEAFKNNLSLSKISVGDDSSLKSIGSQAFFVDASYFSKKSSLETLDLSSCKNFEIIGSGAFERSKLKAFIGPNQPYEIESPGTFWGTNVEEFSFPEGTQTIPLDALRNSVLNALTLPATLKEFTSRHNSLDNSSVSLSDVYYADFTSAFKKIKASDYVKEYPDVLDALGNPTLHIDVSGKAGPLTWKAEGVSGDLTLTISGKGKMPDYNSFSMPWYNGRDEITKIVIEDGVEYIGNYAFYQFENVKKAEVSSTISGYGRKAFLGIPELEEFNYFGLAEPDDIKIDVQYLAAKYSGQSYDPQIAVIYRNDEELVCDKDYLVNFIKVNKVQTIPVSEMKDAGTYAIEVKFLGKYSGYNRLRVPFEICTENLFGSNIKKLSAIELSPTSMAYSGSVQTPDETVLSGRWVLKKNVDYYLQYSAGRTNTGNYTVTAYGMGVYVADPVSADYSITARPLSDYAGDVSLSSTSFVYDGTAHTPAVSISGLGQGSDYTVSYANNVEVGTAEVIISAVSANYEGSITRTFVIEDKKKDDSKGSESDSSQEDSNKNDGSSGKQDSSKPNGRDQTSDNEPVDTKVNDSVKNQDETDDSVLSSEQPDSKNDNDARPGNGSKDTSPKEPSSESGAASGTRTNKRNNSSSKSGAASASDNSTNAATDASGTTRIVRSGNSSNGTVSDNSLTVTGSNTEHKTTESDKKKGRDATKDKKSSNNESDAGGKETSKATNYDLDSEQSGESDTVDINREGTTSSSTTLSHTDDAHSVSLRSVLLALAGISVLGVATAWFFLVFLKRRKKDEED